MNSLDAHGPWRVAGCLLGTSHRDSRRRATGIAMRPLRQPGAAPTSLRDRRRERQRRCENAAAPGGYPGAAPDSSLQSRINRPGKPWHTIPSGGPLIRTGVPMTLTRHNSVGHRKFLTIVPDSYPSDTSKASVAVRHTGCVSERGPHDLSVMVDLRADGQVAVALTVIVLIVCRTLVQLARLALDRPAPVLDGMRIACRTPRDRHGRRDRRPSQPPRTPRGGPRRREPAGTGPGRRPPRRRPGRAARREVIVR